MIFFQTVDIARSVFLCVCVSFNCRVYLNFGVFSVSTYH